MIITSVIGWKSHSTFNRNEHLLPVGCDEFGYLNMAKAISEGRLFSDHVDRPFADELIHELASKNSNPDSYRWMIAPHAYHLGPNEEKIINQYPPGVGLLLAPFPIEYRRNVFPIASVILGCMALALAGRLAAGEWSIVSLAFIPMLVGLLAQMDAVTLELRRVDSLAPTYGLLIGAGWLLPRRPIWSIALLSAATVFRIPNVILFLPFALAFLVLGPNPARSMLSVIKGTVQVGLVALVGGFGVYLAYAYFLLGHPLKPTYSVIDQELAEQSRILDNARFYFITHRSWLFPHLIGLFSLAVQGFWTRRLRWFVFGILLCLFNYGFYLTHKVQIDYYPYATALVCFGLAIGVIDLERIGRRAKVAVIGIGSLISIVMVTTIGIPNVNVKSSFESKIAPYQVAFSDVHVVWGELRTGTVGYAADRAGFRYNWGSDSVRLQTMLWLRNHGYRQAVWIDDEGMKSQEEIESFLSAARIPYTLQTSEVLGDWLLIESD